MSQTASRELFEYLRRIGVRWEVRTVPESGNKVIQIRMDHLIIAEGGEWK